MSIRFGKGARRCKRFGSGWMVCAGRKGKAVLDVLDEFTGAFDGAPVIGIEVRWGDEWAFMINRKAEVVDFVALLHEHPLVECLDVGQGCHGLFV